MRAGARTSALVVGGGFAGLEAAIQLRRRGLDVTMVSSRESLFVYPTSIWLVTHEHELRQDQVELRPLARQHGFKLKVAEVEALDVEGKAVIAGGERTSADVLVLAMGAARMRPAGIEHTHTIWGEPEDTLAVRDRVDALMARGSGRIAVGFGGNPKDGSAMRGGPAFELMFNLDRLLRRRGLRDRFELTFFAPMPKPGARMGERAASVVRERFAALGIEMRAGKRIERFERETVVFEDDARLDADLVVFIPGGTGHPLARNAGLPLNEAGFVQIDDQCQVVGHDAVYAIGDVAALEGPEWRAKQGHLAEVMARVAARAVGERAAGRTPREGYQQHVSIVCLMDMGDGGALVYRDRRKERLWFLPWIGHLLKKAWGLYYRLSKRRLLPWPEQA